MKRFKEIQHAWSVLGDDQKRMRYDMCGEEGVASEVQCRAFGATMGRTNPAPTRRTLHVKLDELYTGKLRTERVELSCVDKRRPPRMCDACKGSGFIVNALPNGPVVKQVCKTCNGRGQQIVLERVTREVEVHIPRGARDGQTVGL